MFSWKLIFYIQLNSVLELLLRGFREASIFRMYLTHTYTVSRMPMIYDIVLKYKF